MEAPLSLEGVTFQYGSLPILKGISLEVGPGSFVGLVGPNGSGKTTLLRIAAGLLKPNSGVVRLGGRAVDRMSRGEIARQIAFLPQNPTLPPAFTARELVLMGRTPFLGFLGQEGPSDLAAVEQAMELTNCRQLAGRRIEELSGGERQRVIMARALAQQPRMLLLDEPTTHMDLQHQVAVVELVAEMAESGLAAVGVFHDLNVAACYCHRLAVLSEGRIAAVGTPAEVLRADTLSEVFHIGLCLTPHPNGSVPAVLPPGPRRRGLNEEWNARGRR